MSKHFGLILIQHVGLIVIILLAATLSETKATLALPDSQTLATTAAEALVKPDSPAFKALEALMNRYDCIVGYPDKKYLKSMTRFAFAGALNVCLYKMNELLTAGVELPESEKITAHWLQEEFAPELERFQQGIFTCTPSTCTLEKQQFSTTTKLQGTPLKVEEHSP